MDARDDDWELVANTGGATRLGFALLLKLFEREGRFPDALDEVPATAVTYAAGQIGIEPDELGAQDWAVSPSTSTGLTSATPGVLGAAPGDEAKLAAWFADLRRPRRARAGGQDHLPVRPPGVTGAAPRGAPTRPGRRAGGSWPSATSFYGKGSELTRLAGTTIRRQSPKPSFVMALDHLKKSGDWTSCVSPAPISGPPKGSAQARRGCRPRSPGSARNRASAWS